MTKDYENRYHLIVKDVLINEGLIGWLMMLQDKITVIKPYSLKENMKERIEKTLKQISIGEIMIYITGDKHGDFSEVYAFCYKNKTTRDDLMIVLGDAGINYYANEQDIYLKNSLLQYPITSFVFMEIMKNVPKI